MHIQTQKLPSFNRIKSADNVPGLKFQLERQLTKESLLVNGFTWIIEPKINKNNERYGGLALGTFKAVQIDQQLIKYNFGAVVSVFKQRNVFINPKIKHLRVFLPDNSKENVQSVFDSSYRFINSNLCKTNVFVFCQNGISKSPIIVAAYLMRQKNIEANSALQEIKKKRKTVMPNETFYSELIEYEKQLSQPKEKGRQMCIIM